MLDTCDAEGHDQGTLALLSAVSLHSCLSKLHRMSLDVLYCSSVYLDVLLRSQPFFPKRLELLLKVVVFLPPGL